MDSVSKTVRGKYNRLEMVNPYNCYFIANYSAGKTVRGNNIIDTGWDNLKDGIENLFYKLSTGRVIPYFNVAFPTLKCRRTRNKGGPQITVIIKLIPARARVIEV